MSEDALSRRAFVGVTAAIAISTVERSEPRRSAPCAPPAAPRVPSSAPLDDLTITDLQVGLQSGKYTARSLVEQYTARIAALDKQGPTLNHVLELNPDALTIADQRDAERRSGK